jgi:ribose/xylose/arabinose/galactoside ABC-type transport system permease subunit
MTGSSRRAARAAGIEPWKPVTGAYLLAGTFVALSAILMSARYGSGEMEHGDGVDYDAISAVLIGGNSIAGGAGSAVRTVLGALGVATVQGLMLTNGFSTESQHLTIGVVVLLAILLQKPEG